MIRDYHPRKGIISTQIVELKLAEQLWLPLDQVRQANVHMFARRFGLKVQTRTRIKNGVKGIRVKRVA